MKKYIVILAIILTGCKSVEIVEVPVYRDRIIQDTRFDSIYIDRWHTAMMDGDTVYLHDSLIYNRYIYISKTDTLIDTIFLPRPSFDAKEEDPPKRWPFVLIISLLVLLLIAKTKK